jgi:hypothetical protein
MQLQNTHSKGTLVGSRTNEDAEREQGNDDHEGAGGAGHPRSNVGGVRAEHSLPCHATNGDGLLAGHCRSDRQLMGFVGGNEAWREGGVEWQWDEGETLPRTTTSLCPTDMPSPTYLHRCPDGTLCR